jgi:hypothetical protein
MRPRPRTGLARSRAEDAPAGSPKGDSGAAQEPPTKPRHRGRKDGELGEGYVEVPRKRGIDEYRERTDGPEDGCNWGPVGKQKIKHFQSTSTAASSLPLVIATKFGFDIDHESKQNRGVSSRPDRIRRAVEGC